MKGKQNAFNYTRRHGVVKCMRHDSVDLSTQESGVPAVWSLLSQKSQNVQKNQGACLLETVEEVNWLKNRLEVSWTAENMHVSACKGGRGELSQQTDYEKGGVNAGLLMLCHRGCGHQPEAPSSRRPLCAYARTIELYYPWSVTS